MSLVALLIAAVVVALIIAGFLRGTLRNGDRVRRMRWRILFRLRPGPGFATSVELWWRWGRLAALHSSRRTRRDLGWARYAAPTCALAVRLGRSTAFRRVYASRNHAGTLYVAPPQRGKSAQVGDRIIDHPGAAVTHEIRPDEYFATAGYRAQRGPVWVLNPGGAADVPSTFGWDLLAGCEDPAEAFFRAADLVGAIADIGEMQWWSDKARGALAAGLHCAALTRRPVQAVWRWALGADGGALIDAARDHLDRTPDRDATMALLATLAELASDSKTAQSVKITMTKSLEWLLIPLLRDVVAGPAAVPFDVPAWIETCGTIYLISPGGDESPTAPLIRCFMSYLHRQAKKHALSLPGRRLTPTVLFAVDEIDKAPVNLPAWLADSAGYGIEVATVIHSTGQLKAKFGEPGLNIVWAASTLKLILGGDHSADTMRDLSALGGTRPGGEQQLDPEIPLNLVWRLPNWRALVLNGNLSPVVVKFRPSWRRWRTRLGRAPALPQLTPAASAHPAPRYDVNPVWPPPAEVPAVTATVLVPPGTRNGDGP